MEVCGLDLVDRRMECHHLVLTMCLTLSCPRTSPSEGMTTALEGPKGLIEVARRAKVGRFRGSRVGLATAAGGSGWRSEELR